MTSNKKVWKVLGAFLGELAYLTIVAVLIVLATDGRVSPPAAGAIAVLFDHAFDRIAQRK